MIGKEQRARIRRLYFAEKWTVGTIASELGVHHSTVRRALELGPSGPRPVRPSKLDPYKAFIEKVLEDHPRLRASRLYAMIRERGYPGSAVQVRRFVRKVRPAAKREAYLRLRTLSGEQAQVDWGHFGKLTVGSARRTLSCFVMVLSHSRAMYARFFLDQRLESFLLGHVYAFEWFAGVPRECLYDNLKSAVLERVGEHIRFHPQLLELAGHYHFAPKACAPYRGNEKGKVERTIQYLRHAFFAAREYKDLRDLNAQLARWIHLEAHARPVPGDPEHTTVGDALKSEKERLLPLPEHRFSCDVVEPVRSGKNPYVRFDLNDYSIPHDQVGKPLTLIAGGDELRIVARDGAVVARHERSYDRGQVVEEPEHLAALAREKRKARELRGRDRLRSLCPKADAFIDALARRGGISMAAQTVRLLELCDTYGAADLDAALGEAMARGAIGAHSVAHILDRRTRARQAPVPLPVVLPDDVRVRELDVKPHDLAAYDNLANPKDDDEP